MRVFWFAAAATAMFATDALASYATSKDDKGCWDGLTDSGDRCFQLSSKTGKVGVDGQRFEVKFKNVCEERVATQVCVEKLDGRWNCFSYWIEGTKKEPGDTTLAYAYGATGKYWIGGAGSPQIGRDGMCRIRFDAYEGRPEAPKDFD